MTERERLERITAPAREDPSLPDDDTRLRDAWLALSRAVDGPGTAASTIDPDDVLAEITRRERRRRRLFWRNTAVMAASVLMMAAVIANAVRHGNGVERAGVPVGLGEPAAVLTWEDDWEAQADSVHAHAALVRESMHRPRNEASIDRRIQRLFEECFRVWATL